MTSDVRPKPVVLMILDGLGISFLPTGNAVQEAHMEHLQTLLRSYPCAAIRASGIDVGLPWGEVGNSEVGHKNIGSGRVIYQPLPQITLAIQNGSFFQNVAFQEAVEHLRERPNASLHLMGCVSTGGVHSHIDHLFALLDFAKRNGVGERTVVHAFLDGRDAPVQGAHSYLTALDAKLKKAGGTLATLVGRYYAMDRNNNWERTKIAYDLLVSGLGTIYRSWEEALQAGYAEKPSDEFVPPSVLKNTRDRQIHDGDSVIFFNFRPDRARQLAEAFISPTFSAFPITSFRDLNFVTMTEYEKDLPATIAFPEEWAPTPIGRVIADAGLRQLRSGETEKYAHVTYYLNSGRELPFPREERLLIPSPNVADYVETPRMSAGSITDAVVTEIRKGKYDVIIVNYANADMLGHTGNMEACVTSLRFLDEQIHRVVETTLGVGGAVLITADHGNIEELINPQTGEKVTDHSANPVPLIYCTPHNRQDPPKAGDVVFQILSNPIGVLADVGPTLLDVLRLSKPPDMTAQSLLASLL